LAQLALETLVVVMDGSVVGRGCLALMLHVVYKGRALPLAWRVRQSPKGHCPEELHIAMVELLSTVLPARAKVVFLGDGEFDGTALQATLSKVGWAYVCRTAMSTIVTWEGETFRLDVVGACIQPGRLIERKEVSITRDAYGPVMVLCCWATGYHEPLYLVSNLATAEEACHLYQKRFRIETFFSDQKSRGFHIQVVLENSNMEKLASNPYLSVQSRSKEDRDDINDTSSGEVYSVFVSESSLRTIQSSRRREHRPSVVDRQTPAHRTTAMHGLHPGVLRTGRHLDGPQQAA
jgi:hypothetical protein